MKDILWYCKAIALSSLLLTATGCLSLRCTEEEYWAGQRVLWEKTDPNYKSLNFGGGVGPISIGNICPNIGGGCPGK